MAKINIYFNEKTYSIEESNISSIKNELKTYLTTVLNGTGAEVEIDGVIYNIDSTKLSVAEGSLEAILGTIGEEVVDEERLEGDGAEYYTLAPTALSFRSTAPLNELQEIQINGVTVDSSNYTLEEGSTIVTFPIDYLKTLNVGSYEVAVASESKTVKGDFTVAAPELNEYGFYYNQPYTAYVAMLGYKVAFFVREDGTFDSITGSGGTETGTYEISGNTIVSNNSLGTLHSTISADGMQIYCTEIATAFVLDDSSMVADEDYIYIHKEDMSGYEVHLIDATKASYGAIKTGVNDIDTVAIANNTFQNVTGLKSVEIPASVTTIGVSAFNGCTYLESVTFMEGSHLTTIDHRAFEGCTKLTSIAFGGTVTQWNAITKGDYWNSNVPATHVHCTDGDVAL